MIKEGLVEDPLIQAIGSLEFEDDVRTIFSQTYNFIVSSVHIYLFSCIEINDVVLNSYYSLEVLSA